VGQVPRLYQLLLARPPIAHFIFPGGAEEGMMKIITEELSLRKMKENTSKMTFIDRLNLNQKAPPEQINDREIMTHAFGNVTAGSDTTSIAMQSIILNILKSPEIYDTLCKEIRSNFSPDEPVIFTKANSLPY
jgi:cytochrome P450